MRARTTKMIKELRSPRILRRAGPKTSVTRRFSTLVVSAQGTAPNRPKGQPAGIEKPSGPEGIFTRSWWSRREQLLLIQTDPAKAATCEYTNLNAVFRTAIILIPENPASR